LKVSFLDLRAGYLELEDEIKEATERVLSSGWYILGNEVEEFEQKFASYCGASHCVGVGNGLDALILSLRVLGVGSGDEVLVPSNTYVATWLAVSHCGAKPVPVEPNRDTYNIDVDLIESSITEKTKAIIPVHLYGQSADLDPILEIAKKYDLKVLEDAAQCHGSKYKGKRIGAHGDAVAWSFYPGKNLGAFGDGGAVTTNNREIAEKVKLFRNYGSEKKYYNDVIGYNSRLDPLQAAVLSIKLSYLDDWNRRRKQIASVYLKSIDADRITLPVQKDFSESVWHLFVISSQQRQAMQENLKKNGIDTVIHYPVPPYRQKAFKNHGFPVERFQLTDLLSESILSLPIGPHLKEESVNYVVDTINKFV